MALIMVITSFPMITLGSVNHHSRMCREGNCHHSRIDGLRRPADGINTPAVPTRMVSPASLHFGDLQMLDVIVRYNFPGIVNVTPGALTLPITFNSLPTGWDAFQWARPNNDVYYRLVSINATGGVGRINLREFELLDFVSITNGSVETVELGNQRWLSVLDLSRNNIDYINLSGAPYLWWLCLYGNRLRSISLVQNRILDTLCLGNNPQLTNIVIPQAQFVQWVNISNTAVRNIPPSLRDVPPQYRDFGNAVPREEEPPTPQPANEDDDDDENEDEDEDYDDDDYEEDGENIPREIPNHINPLAPRNVLPYMVNRETASHGLRNFIHALRSRYERYGEEDETGLENVLISRFAEAAIGRVATLFIGDERYVNINLENILDISIEAFAVRDSILEMFIEEEHVLNRQINTVVTLATESRNVEITISPDVIESDIDSIVIMTPFYTLTFPRSFIYNNAQIEDDPLIITVTVNDLEPEGVIAPLSAVTTEMGRFSYTVEFSRPVYDPISLAVEPIHGELETQTLRLTDGSVASTRYNPVSGMLEARISRDDTYEVITNIINFEDLDGRSLEMQMAIRVLAAQGLVTGVSDTEFLPDAPIDRAGTAALFMRTLSRLNPNADGGFVDVHPGDWFFGAAGSASHVGLMHGTGEARFDPHTSLTRDQLVALAARTLRTEMRYNDPQNVMRYLQLFADYDNIAEWFLTDIALATRENLVIRRADGLFIPDEPITRGEAAIILYRLYLRIW